MRGFVIVEEIVKTTMAPERKKNGKKTETASDLWRRIEQSGLDNALKKLSTSRSELSVISGISSDDAVHYNSVMVELCEMLNCIRLAFVENENEIFDSDEREKRYLKTTCPTILNIWTNYSTFAADFALKFVTNGWLNSSEHRDLLLSVTEVVASSVKLVVMAVNMDNYHSLDDADNLLGDAIQETLSVSKATEEFFATFLTLGEKHAACDKMSELLGWLLFGLNHMSNKVIKVGIEARAPESSFDEYDVLVESLSELTKQIQTKWGDPPKEEAPPPQPTQEKKSSTKETKIEAPPEEKKTKEKYLDTLQKYSEAYAQFSDGAWKDRRLPTITGTGGVQLKYRTECYKEIGKIRVNACAVTKRKELIDSLELTDDHVLHSDLYMIGPGALSCSQEVIICFPLLVAITDEDGEVYLNLKADGKWQKVTSPEIIQEDEQSFITFSTTSCEAFTAMSYCPPETITVTSQGATYTSKDESKIEVVIPENCFTSDVTLTFKSALFDKRGNEFSGIVRASDCIHIASQSDDAEMKKCVTVHLPMDEDEDDKDTELVVARCNDSEVQVLDKKQIAIKGKEDDGVFTVDIKGFWSVAILRIKRIFLNMREAVKREFLVGFGIKHPCNILTFIDDLSRGEETQTFVMEVVPKADADTVSDAKRQTGLIEILKSRSKDILLKRGEQILLDIDGQMRCSEASSKEEQTLCYIQGCSNVISIATEIKRDPEKMPDAMIFYKQKPSDSTLHSIAIMTRDLSELPTDQISARTGMHSTYSESKRGKQTEESAVHILKMESLMSLARELTFEEGSSLGQQLGVKPEMIKQIKESTEKDPVVGNFQILCSWRGPKARATMADFLVSSLKAVGKISYADLVMEVRKHNRGLERTDFQKTKGKQKVAA